MKRLLPLVGLIAMLYACDDAAVFEENQSIANGVWAYEDERRFVFDVEDTVSRHNIYINMRNGAAYPFMNAFLFVKTEFPNGRVAMDTVECFLADGAGEWLGSGIGDIYDNRFLFKQNRAFPIPGTYKIEIRQAMRMDSLPDIYDVGLRISRAK